MPLFVRISRSFTRTATKYVGRLALVLALVFMSLEMIRARGWGIGVVESVAANVGLSVADFWAHVASLSVVAAFGLLVVGLVASWLSRSPLLEDAEPDESIDVAAVTQRIRSFEEFQVEQASRGTHAIR